MSILVASGIIQRISVFLKMEQNGCNFVANGLRFRKSHESPRNGTRPTIDEKDFIGYIGLKDQTMRG
jgi:hypothetical protein